MSNEPTEHEKQIAENETKALCKRLNGIRFETDCDEEKVYDAFLAALTAAKQQRDEDTARLREQDMSDRPTDWQIGYETALDDIDAARGVQPAAKLPSDYPHDEVLPAAKQESAPAAEQQDRRRRDVAQAALHDLQFGYTETAAILRDMLAVGFAPSPAQEKPVTTSVEVTLDYEVTRVSEKALRQYANSRDVASPVEARENAVAMDLAEHLAAALATASAPSV